MAFRPTARGTAFLALATVSVLALSACSSADASDEVAASEEPTSTTYEVDEELRALLPAEIIDAGEIKVGAPYVLPPSISAGDGEGPVGISPDLAEKFGEILGVDFVWSEAKEPIPAIQSGTIDISIGVLSDTAARQEVLDLVDQMNNTSALLVEKGNPEDISDLESLCGKVAAVVSGSQQEIRTKKVSDESCASDPITVNPFVSASDATAQVQSGRAATFIAPYLILKNTAETSGDGEFFEVTEARYPDNPFAMGVAKDRGDFAEAIRGALEKLVDDGTYAEILEKWDAAEVALTPEQVVINGGGTDAFPIE